MLHAIAKTKSENDSWQDRIDAILMRKRREPAVVEAILARLDRVKRQHEGEVQIRDGSRLIAQAPAEPWALRTYRGLYLCARPNGAGPHGTI